MPQNEGGGGPSFPHGQARRPLSDRARAGDIAFQTLARAPALCRTLDAGAAAAELAVYREDDRCRRRASNGPIAGAGYDMIVLPPAFPFGGMENPMLTF